ncbi:hypothetical protein [Streptomyces sp. SID12501]|uniref:Uncharacterized protein n=1 Tax=Streptomyces sp. SID12501 TaxID=2706042 RepID=A0A6B3BTH6_9ACTN|nr:hypothetical protein [Streptomyces sp. SID12501]NEC87636.1 hypothetical protein [Streptomyces sp. SID12501]
MLISLILRVLPFYIREPLAISICLFFSGACFYWTIQAGGWARFGFGVVFLGIAVLRGFILRGELRSRQATKRAAQAAAAPSASSVSSTSPASPASPVADGG